MNKPEKHGTSDESRIIAEPRSGAPAMTRRAAVGGLLAAVTGAALARAGMQESGAESTAVDAADMRPTCDRPDDRPGDQPPDRCDEPIWIGHL